MGLFDSIKQFVSSVDTEYDRRIKAASNVKYYDPTGASHHHGHLEAHNEHVEEVVTDHSANGHAVTGEPTQQQQSNPRQVLEH